MVLFFSFQVYVREQQKQGVPRGKTRWEPQVAPGTMLLGQQWQGGGPRLGFSECLRAIGALRTLMTPQQDKSSGLGLDYSTFSQIHICHVVLKSSVSEGIDSHAARQTVGQF